MRGRYGWLGAALFVLGLVVQPVLTNRAWADDAAVKAQDTKTQPKKSLKEDAKETWSGFKKGLKKTGESLKEDAKETWSGFKKGLKKTGESFKDAGHAIKKDATNSYDKAKKDLSH